MDTVKVFTSQYRKPRKKYSDANPSAPGPAFVRGAHSSGTALQFKIFVTSEFELTSESCFVTNKCSILWSRRKATIYNFKREQLTTNNLKTIIIFFSISKERSFSRE